MQVLFSNGYEGGSITNGLNLIEGEVIKLSQIKIQLFILDGMKLQLNNDIPILKKDITEEENFYFMHGYHAETCEL